MPGSRSLRRLLTAANLGSVAALLCIGGAVYAAAAPVSEQAAPQQRWRWSLPTEFPEPRVPASNPMSAAKVELGRWLFYDTRLSADGRTSCASCHQQDRAFTDGRVRAALSDGAMGRRNTPSLVNVAYAASLTWAHPGLTRLEQQAIGPLFGRLPGERGIASGRERAILQRLRNDPWYRRQFRLAYPRYRSPVKWSTVIGSLATFQRTIISARSRYDDYVQGRAAFTESEQRGADLFGGPRAGCYACHGSFIFGGPARYVGAKHMRPTFQNLGLYNVDGLGAYPARDQGLFAVTGNPRDMGRFRPPALRNVELTAPYMHDGSVATLEEVVRIYSEGGRAVMEGPLAGDGRVSPRKDRRMAPLNLTAQEQADLVAFLKTLTDRAVTTDPRFASPFAQAGRANAR